MSRNLNGRGLGPFAMASKISANAEVWAGGAKIAEYEAFEAKVRAKAAEVGGDCDCVIVRAGTLKGGGCGDPAGGGGDDSFLKEYFYTLGQQDVVNWRMLFDAALPAAGEGAGLLTVQVRARATVARRGARPADRRT